MAETHEDIAEIARAAYTALTGALSDKDRELLARYAISQIVPYEELRKAFEAGTQKPLRQPNIRRGIEWTVEQAMTKLIQEMTREYLSSHPGLREDLMKEIDGAMNDALKASKSKLRDALSRELADALAAGWKGEDY